MNRTSNNLIECYAPLDKPFGINYGEWTIRWWNWALSTPIIENPVLDETGAYANINQRGDVWFLAGTVGDENKIAHRTCEIPEGKAILFPVINYIFADDPQCQEWELIEHVQKDIDDIVLTEATINGQQVSSYRIKSDPSVFELCTNQENMLKIRQEYTKASADGYWVFVKPPNRGEYEIFFHGACSGGLRNASAHYIVKIK